MIKVLVLATSSRHLYFDEFNRRFQGKFQYGIIISNNIYCNNISITIASEISARGRRADIAINFDQDYTNIITHMSCINIKEKRTASYFELLDAINNDGTFNWEKYLQENDDWAL